jgi:hypothetical protein
VQAFKQTKKLAKEKRSSFFAAAASATKEKKFYEIDT